MLFWKNSTVQPNIGDADTGDEGKDYHQRDNQYAEIRTGKIAQVDILRAAEREDAQEDKADNRNGEQNLIGKVAPHTKWCVILSVYKEIGRIVRSGVPIGCGTILRRFLTRHTAAAALAVVGVIVVVKSTIGAFHRESPFFCYQNKSRRSEEQRDISYGLSANRDIGILHAQCVAAIMIGNIDVNMIALDCAAAVLRDKVAKTVNMYLRAIRDDRRVNGNCAALLCGRAGCSLCAPLLRADGAAAVERQLELTEIRTRQGIRAEIRGRNQCTRSGRSADAAVGHVV